jgi:hypothetical protein
VATKNDDACLAKAADDEPIFVLRAQDMTAPGLVEMWISRNPQLPPAKRAEALDCAYRMRQWPHKKMPD